MCRLRLLPSLHALLACQPACHGHQPACLPVLSAYQCLLPFFNNLNLPPALPRRTDWWPRAWWACCGRLRAA
jgi:hypothetical protein